MLRFMLQTGKLISLLALVFLLNACAHQPKPKDQWRLRKDLAAQGVVINQVGETLQLVIPANRLFNAGSANISGQAKTLLPTLSNFVNHFETEQMTITSYYHGSYNQQYNRALAAKRSTVLKNQLWKKGLDARLVNTVGKSYPSNLNEVRIDFMYLPPITAR